LAVLPWKLQDVMVAAQSLMVMAPPAWVAVFSKKVHPVMAQLLGAIWPPGAVGLAVGGAGSPALEPGPAREGYSLFREAMSMEKRYFTSDLSIRS
jgi:hypothetical protein